MDTSPHPLMSSYRSPNRSPGFYDPEHRSPKTNAIVIAVFCFLMGGAFWYSLDTTLTDMTQRDCNAGVQKACEMLR
jgi:hypothetical protein